MVSNFGCEMWAFVQMTASRSLCLTQHSLPITRLFVAVRGTFWELLSFWQPFCSRSVFHRSQTPQATAGQSVGAYEIVVAKLNFRARRKTTLWYLIITAALWHMRLWSRGMHLPNAACKSSPSGHERDGQMYVSERKRRTKPVLLPPACCFWLSPPANAPGSPGEIATLHVIGWCREAACLEAGPLAWRAERAPASPLRPLRWVPPWVPPWWAAVLTVLESSPSPRGERAQFIARLTARIVTSDGPDRDGFGRLLE